MNRGEPPSVHRWLAAVRYTVCQATPKATAKAAPRDRGRHHEHGHEDGHAVACAARCQQRLSRKESAMNTAESRPPRVPPPWFVHTAWRVHRALYRLSGGRFLWTPSNKRGWGALRLTTIGRKSGNERSVIIGYLEDGPNIVALAMNGWDEGHPSWWLNLEAHPDAVVRLARQHPRPVRARLSAEEERSAVAAVGRRRSEPRRVCGPAVDRDARDRSRTSRRDRLTLEPGEGGFRVPQLKRKSRRTSENTYSTHSSE